VLLRKVVIFLKSERVQQVEMMVYRRGTQLFIATLEKSRQELTNVFTRACEPVSMRLGSNCWLCVFAWSSAPTRSTSRGLVKQDFFNSQNCR